MNKELSTNELFHFTKYDRLIGILRNGFYPKYNLEYTSISNLYNQPAMLQPVPMVCFCDIPLNLVKNHTSKYGKCAIALSKVWGNNYGLSPVIYIQENSRLADAIGTITNSFAGYKSSMIKEGSNNQIYLMISKYFKGLLHLSFFLKQFENENEKKCSINNKLRTFEKARFYDEREWRYVPLIPDEEGSSILHIQNFDDEIQLNTANEYLKKHKLIFDIADIKYIIIAEAEQKKEVLDILVKKFKVNYEEIEKSIHIDTLDKLN